MFLIKYCMRCIQNETSLQFAAKISLLNEIMKYSESEF